MSAAFVAYWWKLNEPTAFWIDSIQIRLILIADFSPHLRYGSTTKCQTNQQSSMVEAGCLPPKKAKLISYIMASVFWDEKGILLIDYLEQLDAKISKKRPAWWRQKSSVTKTTLFSQKCVESVEEKSCAHIVVLRSPLRSWTNIYLFLLINKSTNQKSLSLWNLYLLHREFANSTHGGTSIARTKIIHWEAQKYKLTHFHLPHWATNTRVNFNPDSRQLQTNMRL